MSVYSEKLKDPRWQKKRLEIFERDLWRCSKCYDSLSTLVVHHRIYLLGKEPWDYPDELLITLCENCHEEERVNIELAESGLIESVKRIFLSEDMHSLKLGFTRMKLQHEPAVVSSAIAWAIQDTEMQREIINKYFEALKTTDYKE
jgi:hypothetical protein